MSCLSRIAEFTATFTAAEKQIADYIRANLEHVVELNVGELSGACGVSPATIVRFTRTLGFTSYNEMKLDLARDIDADSQRQMDELIHSNDSMIEIAKKYSVGLTSVIANTMGVLKPKDLEHAITLLLGADTIYLFGIGASGLVAQDLQTKLVRINKRCVFYSDSNIGVAGSIYVTKKDVVLAISYGGQTKEVNIPAEFAHKKGIPVIAVTKCAKTKLASLADVCLYIPNTESEVRIGAMQSRTAQMFITDLLYMGIIRKQLDTVDEQLQQSRSMVRQLKEP